MKYPHDMGGEPGLGAIDWEVDEPIFHGEWEKRALALTVGMGFAGFVVMSSVFCFQVSGIRKVLSRSARYCKKSFRRHLILMEVLCAFQAHSALRCLAKVVLTMTKLCAISRVPFITPNVVDVDV